MFNKRPSRGSKQLQSVMKPNYEEYLKKKIQVDDTTIPNDQTSFQEIIKHVFEDVGDFQVRYIPKNDELGLYVYYISGITDVTKLEEQLLLSDELEIAVLKENIRNYDYYEADSWKSCIQGCLEGHVIIHLPGEVPFLVNYVKKEQRTVTEPTTQYQVYGPKIGFIEDSRTNISLIRKLIKDPRLKLKEFTVGTLSHTHVGLLYLEEYVDTDLLELVTSRLESLTMEQLNDGGEIAKKIVDYPMSIFPQVYETERPDYTSIALGQGKIVLVVDNSTFCVVLPATLFNLIEISPDNFRMALDNTFIRLLRIVSILVATILPALYVALVGYHPELLPTTLALTIADSRNNIPFPIYLEAIMMIFALDVLVEASLRLPSFVGQTIGIVGGLVVGQAAVEAGLVSNTMIIVSASTAITSFTLPTWHLISSWRIARYLLIMMSSLLGIFGLTIGIAYLTFCLCNLSSFGKPYLSPATPLNPKELWNLFFRLKNNQFSKPK
ncbi:spore germination protein [Sutcliffiella horikoshii]|uniref:Spore germination protein n=1 Tax=Sutcliffiella horikoshii TaxID=79883 RepID=A0AA95B3Y4_9BACI|nr:spore germination protein [Sutcliffiella horikoshii]TYS54406.1 spore germination protein [Sutcliffiella horikoshii]